MHVGVQIFELRLPGCSSLKAKRSVVKSLRHRIRNRFNVSVAESGALDSPTRAELTVATLGADRGAVDRTLDRVDQFVEADGRALLAGVKREFR